MKRLRVILPLTVLLAVFIVACLVVLTSQPAAAQGNPCPPGQEEKNGCKWVQHRVTKKCMWLPAHSVSDPWEIVPVGTCPGGVIETQPVDPTATTPGDPDPTRRPPLPTPGGHPPREHPGGPGNLVYLLLGGAGLGGLGLAGAMLRRRTLGRR